MLHEVPMAALSDLRPDGVNDDGHITGHCRTPPVLLKIIVSQMTDLVLT